MKFWKGSTRAASEPAAEETSSPAGRPAAVRLVIDTEVFVIAVRSPQSASRRVLDAIADGRAALLIDPAVFDEYRQRLSRALRTEDEQRLSRSWISRAEAIAGNGRSMSRSAPNDKFVVLALSGQADAIVSNDEHRLRLRNRLDVPVLRPDEALRMIGEP